LETPVLQIYVGLGKYEDAIKCYDEIIKIKPDDAFTWYNKGIALANLGKQEDADNCFAKAREIGFII
jgi:tetratricopeptide (TPR) repeat protein